MGLSSFRVNGVPVPGPVIFGGMIWLLYLRFVVPVLGAFYGTSLISDEVEDRTITYLFTRPVPRGAIIIGKYLAYLACTGLVVLPSVTAVYLLITPVSGGSIGGTFPQLLTDLGLLALGLAVYGAVFALIGALVPRPLVAGLLLDLRLGAGGARRARLPAPLHRRALPAGARAARDAAGRHGGGHPVAVFGAADGRVEPDVAGGHSVAALWLAARTVERREYVLDQ